MLSSGGTSDLFRERQTGYCIWNHKRSRKGGCVKEILGEAPYIGTLILILSAMKSHSKVGFFLEG